MSEVRLVVAILVPAIFTLILKDFFDLFMTNRYEGKVKQYTIWMLYFLLDTAISMNFKFVGVISMLCIIVGNALDNAIDGTKDIEGAKKIEISMGVKQGNFLLKVKNTFNPELIKFDNNGKRLRTSKTDKSNHGMGIGLIEETALKYNGLMEITMNENIFCLSVLLYQN